MKPTADNPEAVCYQLWGNDTFSNESYLCGLYRHRSSANRAKHRHELETMRTASEGLRDTYWIVPVTLSQHRQFLADQQEEWRLTREKIATNIAAVNAHLDDIFKFIQRPLKVGISSYKFNDTTLDVADIIVEVTKESPRSKTYHLGIGIRFNCHWDVARISGSTLSMCHGSLSDLHAYLSHDDKYRDSCREHFEKTIRKYFWGE